MEIRNEMDNLLIQGGTNAANHRDSHATMESVIRRGFLYDVSHPSKNVVLWVGMDLQDRLRYCTLRKTPEGSWLLQHLTAPILNAFRWKDSQTLEIN